jgi:hypothetical protein
MHALLFVLAACGHPVPPAAAPVAPTPANVAPPAANVAPEPPPNVVTGPPAVRFDGVYRSGSHGDSWTYFRFYPDHVAIEVGSTGTPADLHAWFDRSREDLSQGIYTLERDHLAIPVKSPEGIVQYDGTIDGGGALHLHWHSAINGADGDEVLAFVAW